MVKVEKELNWKIESRGKYDGDAEFIEGGEDEDEKKTERMNGNWSEDKRLLLDHLTVFFSSKTI